MPETLADNTCVYTVAFLRGVMGDQEVSEITL